MHCKNSAAGGCRCPEHNPGLAAHAADPVAYEAFLERVRQAGRTKLRVVTMPNEIIGIQCDGSMVCPCEACARDRGNIKPRAIRQPWDARAA